MLHFKANQDQRLALQGLAYWIADVNYLRERYGDDEPELTVADQTIKLLFNQLDKLQVPFWVQNSVICFAEDWRRYKREYMDRYLETRNIKLA